MKKSADKYIRKNGVLIVFEGLSGCGKSQNAGLLLKELRNKGYDPVLTEWNSNAVIRSLVAWLDSRKILSPNLYSILQWIGFFLDYFRIILPALWSSRIVIADRYIYTGMARDAVNGAGKMLGRIICFLVRKPDQLYFIDVPSHICLERLKARNTVLFHTNRRIKGNKLLKNKDLYYLNKMRFEYKRLFAEPKKLKVDNILQLDFENDNTEWQRAIKISSA